MRFFWALVFVAAAAGGVYLADRMVLAPGREMQRQLAEKEAQIRALTERNQALEDRIDYHVERFFRDYLDPGIMPPFELPRGWRPYVRSVRSIRRASPRPTDGRPARFRWAWTAPGSFRRPDRTVRRGDCSTSPASIRSRITKRCSVHSSC